MTKLSKMFSRCAALLALCVLVGPLRAAMAQMEYTTMRADGRDVRMTKVADGIYQFTTMRDSYVRQLNSIAVINENDVLLFDTNTRPSTAKLILGEIRKLTNKPIRFVVNSHHHPDHWYGNGVVADAFPDADFIATGTVTARLHEMADVWAPRFRAELASRRAAFKTERETGKAADGSVPTPQQLKQEEGDIADYATFSAEIDHARQVFPNLIYTDSLVLLHGGREFRFISVTGDAEGTTVLYLPRERILLTGDAVSYPIPYAQGKLADQVASLRRLAALDVDIIVPGHGPTFHDKSFLNLERQFLEEIIDGMAQARAAGLHTTEELQARVTVDDLREVFAHGDPDLEARYRARVSALIALSNADKK